MPVCKNDNTKVYVGNEPSPKGLGYCAHAEKLYEVMIGLDNNYWYVSSQPRRWKLLNIPSAWFLELRKSLKKSKIIKKISKGKWYNDIYIHHSNENDVYRNKAFEKEVENITKIKFRFSEQGMQSIGKAHMELDNKNIIKLIKYYNLR